MKRNRRNHRLTINLSPDIVETLDRIKTITGKTYSNQIFELLNELHPTLKLLAYNLEMARDLEQQSRERLIAALDEVKPNFERLVKQAEALTSDTQSQFDLISFLMGGVKGGSDEP